MATVFVAALSTLLALTAHPTPTAAPYTQAPTAAPYTQAEFVLSGYLDPPLNNASYAALARANFTGVFGDRTCVYAGSEAKMCTENAAVQAALCAAHGMKSCFPGFSSSASVKLGGSVQGTLSAAY